MDRVSSRQAHSSKGMPRFMISSDAFFFITQNKTTTLFTHKNFIFCVFKIRHFKHIFITFSSLKSRFIHQVFKVCTGKTRSTFSKNINIHIFANWCTANMHVKNMLTATKVRSGNNHLTVKTTWTQKRRVKHIRSIGCGNKDNAFIRLKAIHFYKKLVQGLFTFIVSAAKSRASLPTHSVDFINKNKAWSILFTL